MLEEILEMWKVCISNVGRDSGNEICIKDWISDSLTGSIDTSNCLIVLNKTFCYTDMYDQIWY